jgi:hypothetical protein
MSTPVYLLNYSTATPVWIQDIGDGVEAAPLAEANGQFPVLWLALFTPANVTNVLVGYDKDAKGAWIKRPGPTLFTSRQEGLATYARRKGAIRNKLGTACARYIDDWERLLASKFAQGSHFQIEFSELNDMYDEGDFEPVLLSWLEGIEELAGDGWEGLCGQAEIENPTMSPRFGLRGWTPHQELAWEN